MLGLLLAPPYSFVPRLAQGEDFSDLAELRLLRLLRRAYLFCLFSHPMLSECCRRQHFSGLESFDASMEDVPIELIRLLENLVGLLDPRSFTAQNVALLYTHY